MKITQATPGPWQSHSDEDHLTIIGDIDGPMDDGQYTYVTVATVEPGDEAHANARLIALAPELLEALIELRIATPGTATLRAARNKADRLISKIGIVI